MFPSKKKKILIFDNIYEKKKQFHLKPNQGNVLCMQHTIDDNQLTRIEINRKPKVNVEISVR